LEGARNTNSRPICFTLGNGEKLHGIFPLELQNQPNAFAAGSANMSGYEKYMRIMLGLILLTVFSLGWLVAELMKK